MRALRHKSLELVFVGFALLFVLSAIIGVIRNYSPVPFWDMWNGYIDFYTRVQAGDVSVWWSQHNEHRILFSRILFWLDIKLFSGSLVFLIFANFLLAVTAFLVFFNCIRKGLPESENSRLGIALSSIVCVLLFSWLQEENFSWAFQSQFFAAQLFPLLGFYFLYRFQDSRLPDNPKFTIACLFGVASAGTMANGILALPLMVVLALLYGMGRGRILVLVILAAATLYLYFKGYHSPGNGHGTLQNTLIHHPIELLRYTFTYLGGPAYHMFKGSLIAPLLVGFFIVCAALFLAFRLFPERKNHPLPIFLLVFVAYVGATAFVTGGGRARFGIEQALASRYMTPAVMLWSALLIIAGIRYKTCFSKKHPASLLGFLLLPVLLVPYQLKIFESDDQKYYERKVAALALELGVNDQQQISQVFPSFKAALQFSRVASQENISIFGNPLIRDARQIIGTTIDTTGSKNCSGSLDEVSNISSDQQYFQVKGWFYDIPGDSAPDSLWLLDKKNTVVGYAVTGQLRPDVAKAVGKNAAKAGYKGYLLKNAAYGKLIAFSSVFNCYMQGRPFRPAFIQKDMPLDTANANLISTASIVDSHEWSGVDYYRTTHLGMKIFGSFINSDADTGSITLSLNRGDSLYYRSGPQGGSQSLEVLDYKGGYATLLPTSQDWSYLEFSDSQLPASFKIKLTDSGSGWGEWSAIAVLEEAQK